MNLFKLKASLLLLLGGLMTATTSQAALTYTAGDIFLGFRSTDTNVTQSYLVNIGPGSTYRDATASFSVAVGNIASDLSTVFGSGWATDPKVYWGVVGTNSTLSSGTVDGDPSRTLYSSLGSDGTIPMADLVGFSRQSSSTQGLPAVKIMNMKDNWLTYAASATANNAAITNAADSFSYTSYAGASQPFSYFASNMEGNFGSGATGTSLDLFRTAPRVGTTPALGSYEGTFTITDTGALTFNIAGVPEPTGVVCLSLTGLAFAARRRRPLA